MTQTGGYSPSIIRHHDNPTKLSDHQEMKCIPTNTNTNNNRINNYL